MDRGVAATSRTWLNTQIEHKHQSLRKISRKNGVSPVKLDENRECYSFLYLLCQQTFTSPLLCATIPILWERPLGLKKVKEIIDPGFAAGFLALNPVFVHKLTAVCMQYNESFTCYILNVSRTGACCICLRVPSASSRARSWYAVRDCVMNGLMNDWMKRQALSFILFQKLFFFLPSWEVSLHGRYIFSKINLKWIKRLFFFFFYSYSSHKVKKSCFVT